jgi:regulator of replication initiation timing
MSEKKCPVCGEVMLTSCLGDRHIFCPNMSCKTSSIPVVIYENADRLAARVAELEAERKWHIEQLGRLKKANEGLAVENARLKNNIEIEALKAELAAMEEDNKTRDRNGYAHAWPGQTFFEVAKKMRELKGADDGH